MGATGNEPPPASPRDDDEDEGGIWGLILLCLMLLMIAFFVGMLTYIWWVGNPPVYSVAIPSASGLDYRRSAAAGGGQPLLDPLFNLTIRIASRSSEGPACMNPTTSVRVSYMGVQLAAESVPPGLCAAPRRRSKELRVVARGQGVAMSPFLLDTLAKDVSGGDALFKVVLMSPHGDHWDAPTCMARIGKPAAKCSWCDVDAAQ